MDFDPLNSGDYNRFENTSVDSSGGNSHGGKPNHKTGLSFFIKFIAVMAGLAIIEQILIHIGRG